MSLLCLAGSGLLAILPLANFTLAWTHSIEKSGWEEDWQLSGTTLVLREARIRGTGAGMEPPPGARFDNGVWHYTPARNAHQRLRLTHSPYTAGYALCSDGSCQPLADLLPGIGDNAVIELTACEQR